MPAVDVNGVSLEYVESGSGEPAVLVHGGVSDLRIWEAQRAALGEAGYRAIAYSGRYHGKSGPSSPEGVPSVLDHVEDLRALVTELGAAPAHLVGNSFGGLLCLLVAVRAPEVVRSLALLEPFAMPFFVRMPPGPGDLLRLALRHPYTAAAMVHFGVRGMRPAQAAFARGDLEGGLECFVRAVLGAYGVERMTEVRKQQAKDNLEAFASQLTQGEFPPLDADDLRRITAPTLLLDGERSPALMRLLTDRVQERLPHAERVTIPEASHDAHVDNPAAVTEALRAFLARGDRARPAAS